MRAYAETAIRSARPVFQIMFALETWPRPIRDFVVHVAGFGQPLNRLSVKRRIDVIGWNIGGIFSPSTALFDVEHVNGYVFRQDAINPIEVFLPNFEALIQKARDQINIDVLEAVLAK